MARKEAPRRSDRIPPANPTLPFTSLLPSSLGSGALGIDTHSFRGIYNLNSTEPGVSSIIQSAHKNVCQLTNLSLACPTIIDFSIKRNLMTVTVLKKDLAVHRIWKVPQITVCPVASGSLAFGKGPRVGHFGVPSSALSRPGH